MWFVVALVYMFVFLQGDACAGAELERIQQHRGAAVADAYVTEGKNELYRGRYSRSVRLLTEALNKGAGIEAYKPRSQAYYGMGKYAEAVADLTKVLQSGSRGPELYVLRGDAFNAQHDHLAALADYNSAIQRDPFWIDAYRGRGTVYVALERYELAIKDFQAVLQKEPEDPEASFNMGVTCMLADLPAAARSSFRVAVHEGTAFRGYETAVKWLAQPPETSEFEQRVGGLQGFLSRCSGPPENFHVPPREGATVNKPQIERSARTKPPPKGLLELRGALHDASSVNKVLSGELKGTYMGFRWRFRFETKGRDVSATIVVQHPTGKEEVHHCRGTVDGSFVEARDQEGYRFQGRLTDDFRLKGQLTTNHGRSFTVDMPLEQ